jgi:hypothetical protein
MAVLLAAVAKVIESWREQRSVGLSVGLSSIKYNTLPLIPESAP